MFIANKHNVICDNNVDSFVYFWEGGLQLVIKLQPPIFTPLTLKGSALQSVGEDARSQVCVVARPAGVPLIRMYP